MTEYAGFLDAYLDDLVPSAPCQTSPRFLTTIAASYSGHETRTRNWQHPLRRFRLPEVIREQETFETVLDHWLVMGGPERIWPFRDPLDFASVRLELPNTEPTVSRTDQALGTGDGSTRTFQLKKAYTRGGETYYRNIEVPILSTVLIGMGGVAPESVSALNGGPYTASVSRPGGIVTFTPAPIAGLALTWGGLFDVPVRFEADDSFDGIVQNYQISGMADLTFVEVRLC